MKFCTSDPTNLFKLCLVREALQKWVLCSTHVMVNMEAVEEIDVLYSYLRNLNSNKKIIHIICLFSVSGKGISNVPGFNRLNL